MDDETTRKKIEELKRLLETATDPEQREDIKDAISSIGLTWQINQHLEDEPPESASTDEMTNEPDRFEGLPPAPSSHPGIPRGNKDKRLAASMPNAYAEACEKAKKEGTLDQHLRQVADELAGFDS